MKSLLLIVGSVVLACALITEPLPSQSVMSMRPAPLVGFGAAAVMSGEELFVARAGEFGFFPMPPMQRGVVHVFARGAGESWTRQTSVSAADAQVGDGFGQSVAVHGNVMLVGAPKQADAQGGVYVYERWASGEWSETVRLIPDDAAPGDSVGFALALYEGTAVVGAPGRGEAGAAYIFRRDPTTGQWTNAATLVGSQTAAGDRFGAAVALNQETALVGAPGPHTVPPLVGAPPPYRAGSAYVFHHNNGHGWQETARLATSDPSVRSLGIAVSLEWDGALVSAPMTNQGVGAVLHFEADGQTGVWTERGRMAPAQPAFGLFGYTVSKAGADIFVGAPSFGGLAGAVHVFRQDRITRRWIERQQLTVGGLTMGASFGAVIATQGEFAMVAAPGGDFFEGTGYLYRLAPDGRWSAAGTLIDEASGMEAIVDGQVDCDDGKARMFTCSEVDLVSFLPVSALGGERGIQVNDVWGWTDPQTRREYAIVGRFDGTAFVDVTDPARPRFLGDLPLHQGAIKNLWRDIKVYQNHAYIVSDGAGPHGVQIFDLTQLRSVEGAPRTFTETAHYDGIYSAHNIVINEATGFAYVVGASMGGETCGGGLHMLDLREPTSPQFVGCFAHPQTGRAQTGYTHDAMCVIYNGPDVVHQGKEICFSSNETALSISDVTDKAQPVPLAAASYPNVVYAHQGWISEDHRYFFTNDEGDEVTGVAPRTRTMVWDIEDLDDPVLLTEYLGETGATDHNLYVRGSFLYESNYVAGLRIIDIRNPANPREIAFFDTVPFGKDAPGFAGSWSNYPFFASGNIIVTSMREGLFVLKKRPERLLP